MKGDMTTFRKRIDALEHVVAMANMNLSTLEAAVDKAEADLGVSDRLFGMLNPLSFFVSTTCSKGTFLVHTLSYYMNNYALCIVIVVCKLYNSVISK